MDTSTRITALVALAFAALLTATAAADAPKTCIGCDLARSDLHGVDLRGAQYVGSNFAGSNLRGANLERAKLIGVNFSKSDMRDARLDSSTLVGADFANAALDGASFRGAVVCVRGDHGVSCIDLRGATLSHTDFRGALFCRSRHLRDCTPVEAATLRTHSHNALDGAILQ
jgi:uncharacterized protein YjbI with pentapeptide repeats